MYLYGSGFPKGMNIGLAIDKRNGVESEVIGGNFEIKEAQNKWKGWNTQLKPAYEPIIVAQKPVKKSIIDNVLEYGVGGLNIDECKVGNETIKGGTMPIMNGGEEGVCNFKTVGAERIEREDSIGRYPSNVIHDGSDEAIKDMPNTKSTYNEDGKHEKDIHRQNFEFLKYGYKERFETGFNDEGSASRYFYCAKASAKDRDEGLDDFEEKEFKSALNTKNGTGERLDGGKTPLRRNTHTTVKPTQLMQYLVRLVSPKGATILDVFNGSGSTGKVVMFENKERNANYKYIGIELTEEYLPISKARIEYVINNDFDFWKDENGKTQYEKFNKTNQLSLFDFLGGTA